MAISEGSSCEICLRADDPEAVFNVKIDHVQYNAPRVVTICRDCAATIAAAAAAADDPPVVPDDNERL
ncbi:MAG TPA: hypothetical protein VGH29_00935 [Candidatus Binataceae bacterium]|jgi:hypothetical protein